jgi:Regulator of chromosome condensation (RCC1) repeat
VHCWGRIGHDEFSTPVAVKGLQHVAQIAVALDTFCARMEDLSLRCWGGNNAGQIGDGRTQDEADPVPVEGVANAVDVIPGADHSCAVIRDGTLRCWGGVTPAASPDTPALPLAQRVVSLGLDGKRRILRMALLQTPDSELSLYAVADDGTVWWVAAPERRLAGRWLGLNPGGPFTTIVFRSNPGGFDSKYDATGTAPAPDCQAPRCASRSGESGDYSVHGQDLVLSSDDRTIPDSYRFDLTTSTLALSADGYSNPFRFIRACDTAESCDTFDLSRAPGKGAWQCEKERCFWVGAPPVKKKKPKKKTSPN